ncbi:hypothetical protein J6590_072955 [Homalodisca vitripennis]|nr:hypothetical protein J6590_072955 [Homalodisca vitripennis]
MPQSVVNCSLLQIDNIPPFQSVDRSIIGKPDRTERNTAELETMADKHSFGTRHLDKELWGTVTSINPFNCCTVLGLTLASRRSCRKQLELKGDFRTITGQAAACKDRIAQRSLIQAAGTLDVARSKACLQTPDRERNTFLSTAKLAIDKLVSE